MDGKQLLAGFRSIDRSLCHHLVGKDLYPSARNLEVLRFPESALFPHSRKSLKGCISLNGRLHRGNWVSRKPSSHEWCDQAAPQMPLWCCTHVCWVCNQRMLCISTRPLTLSASLPSFFLEKNMFVFFLNILRQKSGRYVCVQLLQTLNILFENISHETSLCKDGPGPGLGTAGCRCAPCAVVFLLLCECLCPPCVLACLGCQRACSRLGSLDGRCIFSQCLRLAVHDHGSAGAGFWGGLSSWFAQGLTLFMSYLFSPLCTWREDSDVSSFSCKDTSLLGSEPHPLTSCDL